ncbi:MULTISPECIES: SAM-dependent methyltransferase [Streptomyces]|uniref:SAM-dependent methyltransferase n=2 Tax=Streptomyces TaxID=1883 RepID=A0A3R7I1K6_9ACTN|nr:MULTISPECIES: SAM-dependent methyltransferase [Streptomyces]KNE79998.1 methyltransferase [Streptomyces fradiae]OFA56901.1 methyltransferase [Streptomyces fradiae]PQM23803.1 methyltransferase [Streptomyces xinghaiensis]RKM91792.1 SAM-dependent methyltransferase [Streptomyces xinghaiensis]RNC73496.1 SAM-dependent methyltransferase [Streptomyces xinghaiensis]
MTDQNAAPAGIDTSVAHSARMYDYWLGGSSNFEADRELGKAFETAIPSIRTMARENRRFLGRAIRQMAGEGGIRQFLDIGTGVPAAGDTHSVTEIVAPDSRVVCVDNDPIVQAHAKALMEKSPEGRTVYVQADLRKPGELLAHPEVAGHLDFERPVGLLLVAVLMLLKDQDRPWATVAALLDAMPPGSQVAITHPTQDFNPEAMSEVVEAAARGQMTLVPRTRAQVSEFFGDWELLEPGVVPVMGWRPEEPPADPRAAYYWGGVARKKG